MKEIEELDWTGVESELLPNLVAQKCRPGGTGLLGLFCLLPCLNLSGPRSGSSGLPKSLPTRLLPGDRDGKAVVKKLDLPAPTLETPPAIAQ